MDEHPIDLQETFQRYSKMLHDDFIMPEFGKNNFDLTTMSIFNSYSTDVSELKQNTVKNTKKEQNKIKRYNIPNATITRHSHFGSRTDKYDENQSK